MYYVCLLLQTVALSALMTLSPAYAGTPMSERVAVETGVRADVNKDLALPDKSGESLADRHCLDGRAVKDIQGDVVEYWVNLEWCAV